MVILFILVGTVVGAIAAFLALWTGGSILFALLCYSAFGSLGALTVVFALYMRGADNGRSANWTDDQKGKHPVSA